MFGECHLAPGKANRNLLLITRCHPWVKPMHTSQTISTATPVICWRTSYSAPRHCSHPKLPSLLLVPRIDQAGTLALARCARLSRSIKFNNDIGIYFFKWSRRLRTKIILWVSLHSNEFFNRVLLMGEHASMWRCKSRNLTGALVSQTRYYIQFVPD